MILHIVEYIFGLLCLMMVDLFVGDELYKFTKVDLLDYGS